MRRLTLCTLLASLLLSPSQAEQLPELGDPSAATINTQQEQEIGETVMQQIRGQW
jgi:predicted Zn-dependent protease